MVDCIFQTHFKSFKYDLILLHTHFSNIFQPLIQIYHHSFYCKKVSILYTNLISNYIYISHPFKILFAALHFHISNLTFLISSFLHTLLNLQGLFWQYQLLSTHAACFSIHISIISINASLISDNIHSFPVLPIAFLNSLPIFQSICTLILCFAQRLSSYHIHSSTSPHYPNQY